ncbi:hypothetical protein MKW98_030528 [Papaver atlanticum]|uniref:Leucine-rich repeat-containing N-terminal plant-type domain-containing protein n=1 Tax=Papaver atlanticum TaxID=357466 RepID=A0AAD4T7Y9_9MAGN|nr:hypothetical protein MKW98_030528 [Papaver atlanticum]
MKKNHGCLFVLLFTLLLYTVESEMYHSDVVVMQELRNMMNYSSDLGWSGEDPCKWVHIYCDEDQIKDIRLGNLNIYGTLPQSLNNLQSLQILELQGNHLSGNLLSLSGLRPLKKMSVKGNRFSSIPGNFFDGLSSLKSIILDDNPFAPWGIPDSLKCASKLVFLFRQFSKYSKTSPEEYSLYE